MICALNLTFCYVLPKSNACETRSYNHLGHNLLVLSHMAVITATRYFKLASPLPFPTNFGRMYTLLIMVIHSITIVPLCYRVLSHANYRVFSRTVCFSYENCAYHARIYKGKITSSKLALLQTILQTRLHHLRIKEQKGTHINKPSFFCSHTYEHCIHRCHVLLRSMPTESGVDTEDAASKKHPSKSRE